MTTYQTPAENLPPVLPIERKPIRVHLSSIYEPRVQISANRVSFEVDVDRGEPDTILLNAYYRGVSAEMQLTPAMIVHLANTILTDNERGAIVFPLHGVGAP